MSDVTQVNTASRKRKWIKAVLWFLAIVALTAALVYLLWLLESHFRVPMSQYASLAYLIVFVATFFTSCTIIFPAPGIVVVMAAASMWNPVIVALVASVGGSLGEVTAYYAGYIGKKIIINEHQKSYNRAVSWMNRYGIWAIFFFAMIPMLIFDLVGLAAGALKFPLWKFILACWAGRIPRAFVEAYIGAGIMPLIFPSWFLSGG
jgi:membrane protein YqaA with SNARE-associated domain